MDETRDPILAGVVEPRNKGEVVGGSTDVGDVSYIVPTAQINTVCQAFGTPGHSWQAVVTSGSSIGFKGMMLAAETLALATLELADRTAIWCKLPGRSYKRVQGGRTMFRPCLRMRYSRQPAKVLRKTVSREELNNVTKETAFAQNLIDFIHASPSPFHVVKNIEAQLAAAGFSKLMQTDRWELDKGGKYYVTRNDSAIIAFVVGSGDVEEEGSASSRPTPTRHPSASSRARNRGRERLT